MAKVRNPFIQRNAGGQTADDFRRGVFLRGILLGSGGAGGSTGGSSTSAPILTELGEDLLTESGLTILTET